MAQNIPTKLIIEEPESLKPMRRFCAIHSFKRSARIFTLRAIPLTLAAAIAAYFIWGNTIPRAGLLLFAPSIITGLYALLFAWFGLTGIFLNKKWIFTEHNIKIRGTWFISVSWSDLESYTIEESDENDETILHALTIYTNTIPHTIMFDANPATVCEFIDNYAPNQHVNDEEP